MDFIPLNIDSKNIINDFFKKSYIQASDALFGNLYIWHFSRKIEYVILHECLVIITTYPNNLPFIFYPLGEGDRKKAIQNLIEYFSSINIPLCIHSMEISQKEELISFMPDTFTIEQNRDRFDYLYSVEDLINLNGRKYHNKKNHLNRFFATYPNFVYEKIDCNNAKWVLSCYKDWLIDSNNLTDGLRNESLGIEACLNNFHALEMRGGMIKIDDTLAAFSLGEQINSDSVVIHIEKANKNYTGIYQAINQQFLENEWSEFKFVNREEDLGIEGLRKAKMTYHPIAFVEKFYAKQK